MRLLFSLLVVAFAVGCGKPNLGASCRKLTSVSCKKAFECNRAAAEIAYQSEGNCVSTVNTYCAAYDNWDCDDLTAYERCINDYAAASCAASTSFSCQTGNTSNCQPRGSGGRVSCQNSNVNTQSSSCSVTLTNCTDGRSYVLACSGSSCTCNDGSTSRSVSSGCSSKEAAIATCGWNVQ